MPRKSTWPPKIYVHKPTNRDRIRVKRADGRYQDIWLGPSGSDAARAEYARAVAEIAATGLPPGPRGGTSHTVAEVVSAWTQHAAATYSERGRELENFRYSLQPLLRLYGHTPAAEFDAPRLEAVQLAMASGSWMRPEEAAAAAKVGWCRNVVNRRVVRIRTVWRWAERKKLVPPGAFAHLCSLPGLGKGHKGVRHTKKRTAATWEATRAVVRAARARKRGGNRIAAMLLLQWWAGMRSCEVRIMRPCDIDQSDPTAWLYTPGQHKGDWREDEAPRIVPLGPKCQAVLRPWLAAAASPEDYLFTPRPRLPRQPYSAGTYAQAVGRLADRAGQPDFVPYRCRHAAKERIARAAGSDAARQVLGHRSINTTEMYGARDVRQAADVARKLA